MTAKTLRENHGGLFARFRRRLLRSLLTYPASAHGGCPELRARQLFCPSLNTVKYH
ncbi:unnamed protein product, partial [Ascophyllum nodosum]